MLGLGAAGGLAALGWVGASTVTPERERPLALVYRGPAACSGCAEAVAALLRNSPARFRTEYCGPDEERRISESALAEAAVYAQPGGGDVDRAWRRLDRYADRIREFVHNGGHYLGFCLGAYLAGDNPGFAILNGKVDRYISSRGASVDTTDDVVIQVQWRGQPRYMFFQDGPTLELAPSAQGTVIATYDTGAAAAVVATFGAGRVGLVGPHPEADQSWYDDADITNPEGVRFDLGYDFVQSTVAART